MQLEIKESGINQVSALDWCIYRQTASKMLWMCSSEADKFVGKISLRDEVIRHQINCNLITLKKHKNAVWEIKINRPEKANSLSFQIRRAIKYY